MRYALKPCGVELADPTSSTPAVTATDTSRLAEETMRDAVKAVRRGVCRPDVKHTNVTATQGTVISKISDPMLAGARGFGGANPKIWREAPKVFALVAC